MKRIAPVLLALAFGFLVGRMWSRDHDQPRHMPQFGLNSTLVVVRPVGMPIDNPAGKQQPKETHTLRVSRVFDGVRTTAVADRAGRTWQITCDGFTYSLTEDRE